MKKISKIISLLLIAVFGVSLMASPVSAAVTKQSIAIPVYQYPTLPMWTDITAAGSQVPFVVVNPASGPGTVVDPNYTNQIATNTTAGQRSIGYVDTNYQARSASAVTADIDQWKTLYPGTTGYMMDRVSVGTAADLFYTAYIYNYIKAKYPNSLVVQNFGTYTAPAYEPYGDIFINAEMGYTLYNSSWTVPNDGFQNNPVYQDRFWHIIHTTNTGDFTATLNKTRASNAGWVYITDDVLPNPYDDIATYWSTELTSVASLPQTTIPNRGATQLPNTDLIVTPTVNTTPTLGIQKNTYTSQFSLTNTSSTYTAISPSKITFSLPGGVQIANSSGSNWSCTGNECTFTNDLGPGVSSSSLNAIFDVGCSYASGNITATYATFTGNTTSSTIAVARPACTTPSGGTGSDILAPTGQSQNSGILISFALIGGAAGVALIIRRKAFARSKK